MSSSLTDKQFKDSLALSIACAKKRWHHSIDLRIADIIAAAREKDRVIAQIMGAISECSTAQEMLQTLDGFH